MLVGVVLATTGLAGADEVRDQQWHLRFLDIPSAHKISDGSGVTVAVIDSGVDLHPDLAGNVLPGTEIAANGSDGRSDLTGHGTGMAGIIAAHGQGATGILGIAPKAKILPIAVDLNNDLIGQESVAKGINWARMHGAKVINISGDGNPAPDLRAAVEAAIAADIVVVAAAGNRPSSQVGFPAAYPGVVAVGATDRDGDLAATSVTGDGLVIAAPGIDIMTTRPHGRYGPGTGTSDAAAIVSGAVALVRSRFPELSAVEVVRRLTATATDKGAPGRDDQYGFGVLNLVAALTADLPPPTQATPSQSAAAPAGPDGDGSAIGIVALVVVGVVIAGFVLHVRARRHRAARGPVP
ncbi:type VII secretion-associated serine protease mycosin [Asanoa ferruginea]|uniref:Type VII secretion-associated serine protease mycosin n=2 Tax=Asanoa ferruginea TaxID=53367 RepID=A0A3D9ZTM9_9ACTN|nr:type VII secretion-associated serine protease mycosin [Asanoa ferruginea]